MKKVAVVVLALVLLTMMFAAVPVMAAPAQKVPASCTAGTLIAVPSGETRVTPSGVVLLSDWTYDLTAVLTIDGVNYPILSLNYFDGIINPLHEGAAIFRFDAVWYVGDGLSVTPNGFRGNIDNSVDHYQAPGAMAVIHCTLQGFGSFAGQTLLLSYSGPVATEAFYGVDIIH